MTLVPESREDPPPQWAPNPFALAEIALGEAVFEPFRRRDGAPTADSLKLSFDETVARIADILLVEDPEALIRAPTPEDPVPSILHLFDAVWDRLPEFGDVDTALKSTYYEAEARVPRAKLLLDRFFKPENRAAFDALRRVVPYLFPLLRRVREPGGPGAGGGRGADWQWRNVGGDGGLPYLVPEAGQSDTELPVDFLDPVQGAISDCYLIAPMIALAWTLPSEWNRVVREARRPDRYVVNFYKPTDRTRTSVATSSKVPLAGQRLAYARSNDGLECWPAIFEKAYVQFRRELNDADPQDSDYAWIGSRDGRQHLLPTACRLLGTLSYDTDRRRRMAATPTADVLKTLRARCGGEPRATTASFKSYVTRDPTMAWIREKGGGREALLAANHAYAVLGLLENTAPGNKETYVILRNPHGLSPQTLPKTKYCQAPVWQTGRTEPGLGKVALNAAGVFGLKLDVFMDTFCEVVWAPRGPG